MSATLGALVIALSTEFAVLLDGALPRGARGGPRAGRGAAAHYRSTGAAVLASGATAIAGFAVLAFSDVRMLREFGIVTVVDLSVSLLGVLAVLPAVLVLAERRAAAAARARRAPAATGRAGVRGGWLVGARRRARARLHHAQHAADRGRGLARAGAGAPLPPFAMPLARAAGRRRQHRHAPDSGPRAPAGVRGARPGDPQRLRAGRARAGRARVPRDRARATASEQVDVLDRVAPRFRGVRVRRGRRCAATARSCAAPCASAAGAAGRLRPRRRGREPATASRSARCVTFARRGARWRARRSSSSTSAALARARSRTLRAGRPLP